MFAPRDGPQELCYPCPWTVQALAAREASGASGGHAGQAARHTCKAMLLWFAMARFVRMEEQCIPVLRASTPSAAPRMVVGKEDFIVAQSWRSRTVALTLPLEVARSMWGRAVQWDVTEGGRFEVCTCRRLVIWPGAGEASYPGEERREPIAAISIRWHTPAHDSATVCRLAWRPAGGGSEALVWQGLRALGGATPARR